jgi:CIC family chloride channel protein
MLARAVRHLGYALAIVAVGIMAAGFAIVFRGSLHVVFQRAYGEPDVLRAFQALPPAARLLLPAAGAAVASVLGVLAARHAVPGHGVGQILEAVTLGRGRISMATTLWRALASFLAMATGGSIGREGSMLQFGAASGSTVAGRLGVDAKRARALVAAGTAAGFAAAYNTPIAAVIFVLEVVTGVMALDVVLPVVVATTLATWLTRAALGAGPLYGFRSFVLQSGSELGAYAALGILAGLVGPAFMHLLDAGNRLFRRLALPAGARGALGGLVVGVLALRFAEVNGNGYEAIQLMLDGSYGAATLAALLVVKAIATTASFSSGSPGGVFTPSLFLGAAAGGLAGALAQRALPAHGPAGGYVLVGMAGVIAATTHAPVMATVLGFELSGDYGVVLPLMMSTVLATVLSRRLRPGSIYTEELLRRGIPWEGSLAERIARAVRARDIFEMDPYVVDRAAPAQAALDILGKTRARVVFVTGGDAGSVGAIDLHIAAELWSAADGRAKQVSAGALARPVPTAAPDDTLLELSEKLFDVDWGEIPVVGVSGAERGRVLGVVSRRALLAAFDRELLQRDLLYTRVVWFEGQAEAADFLELPRGHRVEIIAPPAPAVGTPVDVAGLRARDGVIVLGVRQDARGAGGPDWKEAESVATTAATDRWLVVGTQAAIQRLRARS